MKYRVLQLFDDLTDYTETKGGLVLHRYNPGDIYPRDGKSTTAERVAELMGTGNRQGVPLIVPIDGPANTIDTGATAAQDGEKAQEPEKSTPDNEKPLKTAASASRRKAPSKTAGKATPKKRVQ